MSPANHYKKVENKAVDYLKRELTSFSRGVVERWRSFVTTGKQRFTVMFIPHSEKKIFNFKISIFSLVFMTFLFTGVVIAFFIFSTRFSGMSRLLFTKDERLTETEQNLELIRDEVSEVSKSARRFKQTLNSTIQTLSIQATPEAYAAPAVGDFAGLLEVEQHEEGVIRELSELQSLRSFLDESVDSLNKITELLVSHGDLLVELPTIWPVDGGIGRITNYFGPAEHPFTKKWYLHKGIDIAYRRGKPIIATAQGKVVERKYESMGFGHYVLIRHGYGFYTKYAHLDAVFVEEGDVVTQGQQIGLMGSTGLSTGPHLHYEVRIGSQVIDPERFLNIQKSIEDRTGIGF